MDHWDINYLQTQPRNSYMFVKGFLCLGDPDVLAVWLSNRLVFAIQWSNRLPKYFKQMKDLRFQFKNWVFGKNKAGS